MKSRRKPPSIPPDFSTPKLFSPETYGKDRPPTWCLFCGMQMAVVTPFVSGRSKRPGLTVWCPYCKTRLFLYKEEAGLAAEAYRQMFEDEDQREFLRAALQMNIDNIKRSLDETPTSATTLPAS